MADVHQNAPAVGKKKRFPRPFGRYVLEKSISRGGMGDVMLAIPRGARNHCVIKTIRGDLTGDEEFVGRFADEAKIMVRISHENIIRVFDAGKVGSDYYIAMEFVHGRDLGDVLDRAYERGDPMPVQLGLYITSELMKGLEYAHNLSDERGRHMGLVHRDISPQNVLVGFDGSIRLIDFGLARTEVLPGRTQGALAVGKYGYMSPEQARHRNIDGRADIYSSGVMLFEVFTGDRLVDEQDQTTLWARVLNPSHRNPRSVIPSLPPEVDELVMRAVEVKPADRYQSAAKMRAFVDALRRTHDSSPRAMVHYLRFLYPSVDFRPPPVPDLSDLGFGEEASVIIATSREGALSVFGRGDLPIEWTRQVDVTELRQGLHRKQAPAPPGPRAWAPTDPSQGSSVPPGGRLHATRQRRRRQPPPTAERNETGTEQLTQVSILPQVAEAEPMTEKTRFSHSIVGPATDEAVAEDTVHAYPVHERGTYSDEERTVMMPAPPTPGSTVRVETPTPRPIASPAHVLHPADRSQEAQARPAAHGRPGSTKKPARPFLAVHGGTMDTAEPSAPAPQAPEEQPLFNMSDTFVQSSGLVLTGAVLLGVALLIAVVILVFSPN